MAHHPRPHRSVFRRPCAGLASLAVLLALGACAAQQPSSVPSAQVEEQVLLGVGDQLGTDPRVTCPQDVPAEVGASTTCEVSVGTATTEATVVVVEVTDGVAVFDVTLEAPST